MAVTTGRITISDELVAALLREQFPDLAGEEIGRHYALPDRTVVRIGDHHGFHMPTVPGLDAAYERSARLVAPFLSTWTFPLGAPIATGRPGHGYPYHFEVTRWIDGSTAGMVPLHDSEAAVLGDALRQIHAPTDSPLRNSTTSVPLTTFATPFARHLERAGQVRTRDGRRLDSDSVRALWDAGVDERAPAFTWTHGSIDPRSLISDQGRFVGLVDWRHFAPGDPALDLGPMLMHVPKDSHAALLEAYGDVPPEMLRRATAALMIASVMHAGGDEPFAAALAWRRLDELGLLREA
ncbi:phosphotransferase [Demequina zhanjiangensis]|uniref:Phosphotransferase n=1 Tax=Demequina zhanjiangensis TaxID=3051659 RepID=A0ABT8G0S3_9MICO|nr:phosphotransferase [Demequina sp. SYSU T00b26]MDN4472309.1 phosphotransferase [Demequina sp. SYSU T00b26]